MGWERGVFDIFSFPRLLFLSLLACLLACLHLLSTCLPPSSLCLPTLAGSSPPSLCVVSSPAKIHQAHRSVDSGQIPPNAQPLKTNKRTNNPCWNLVGNQLPGALPTTNERRPPSPPPPETAGKVVDFFEIKSGFFIVCLEPG